MNIKSTQTEFLARITELRTFCAAGSAWVFVCTSAFLEYFAKVIDGKNRKRQGYIDFVDKWLSQVRPAYKDFKYMDGPSDLPIQMYHVLRRGIVHSLSLVPDEEARSRGGRDRSIVLCHRAESVERGLPHLSNYSHGNIKDAALFVAEDFIDDIEKVINIIFDKANADQAIKDNILKWLSQHPLIKGGY